MSDLTLRYGETRTLDIVVTNEDGSAANISGSTFWLTVKADWLDADADALMVLDNDGQGGIAITGDGSGGLAEATVTPSDWTDIDNEPQRLVYGLTEKDSGNSVHRLDEGTLLATPVAKETVA